MHSFYMQKFSIPHLTIIQIYIELEGLKITPLMDGVNLGTLTQFGNS